MDTVLTRLAARGTGFLGSHICALCMPSRGTLLTGLDPWNHGITDDGHISPTFLNVSTGVHECTWEYTLFRWLKECPWAYNNIFVGKWCNDSWYQNMNNQAQPNGQATVPPGWNVGQGSLDHFIQSDPGPTDPHPINSPFWEDGSQTAFQLGSAEPDPALLHGADGTFFTIAPELGFGSRALNADPTYDTNFKQDVWRIKAIAALDECIADRIKTRRPFAMYLAFNTPHQGTGTAKRFQGNNSAKATQINDMVLTQSQNFHQVDARDVGKTDPAMFVGTRDDYRDAALIPGGTGGGDSPAGDQISKRRGEMAGVAVIDEFLKQAFQRLDAAGLTDKTLFVYVGGDNGVMAGENWGTKGKQDTNEASSLFTAWLLAPGYFGTGVSPVYPQGMSGLMMSTADLVPTIVDVLNRTGAGIVPRLVVNKPFDGQSLLDPAISPLRGVAMYDTKGGPNNKGFVGWRNKNWKVVLSDQGGPTNSGQFQVYKHGDSIDSTFASLPAQVINGISVPALPFPIEQDLHNRVNVNTGVAFDPADNAVVAQLYNLAHTVPAQDPLGGSGTGAVGAACYQDGP